MKKFLAGWIALAAGCLVSAQALAFGTIMCYPDVAVGPNGPRTWYNPTIANSTLLGQSSQNPYVFSSQGCAYINQADIAAAFAIGMTQGNPTGALMFLTGVQTGTTNLQMGNLPANTYIVSINITNVTANAAGNISIGSASGGAQFVSAFTVAASTVYDATLVTQVVNATAPTAAPYNTLGSPIWITSSAWGSANLAVTVTYNYF